MWAIWIAAVVLLFGAGDASAQRRCIVADPTATQLNVRASPGGPRLGNMTLPNGMPVIMLRQSGQWAYVTFTTREPVGWVFRPYLDC